MFIVDIIYDTGSLVRSQFRFDGVVEDGGEQGIQLGGSLDWLRLGSQLAGAPFARLAWFAV
jgi:hypothetical protein